MDFRVLGFRVLGEFISKSFGHCQVSDIVDEEKLKGSIPGLKSCQRWPRESVSELQ